MSRSLEQRIDDILEAIGKCERYIRVVDTRPELSDMAMDAVERNLQIVGEAANHLPASVTAEHPEIEWPQIRGFRNILVHQYFGVHIDVVRDVVESHLPALAKAVRMHRASTD